MRKLLTMKKPVTVVTGPAGTGKTLIACRVATEKLLKNQVHKIIITRPTVSADEDLGYLPGKLEKKMDPWIRPMFELFETAKVHKSVEIVPLAYMRGRTFKNAFIIADEMQNSTKNQMKMILTRIGDDSNMVVTGDTAQSDLGYENGLRDLVNRLDVPREYLEYIQMSDEDIQRHPAVKEILGMYDEEFLGRAPNL
jgi:phosphate starvation-inducible PhoH-like protein